MSLAANAVRSALATAAAFAGEAVTYSRSVGGSVHTVDLTALPVRGQAASDLVETHLADAHERDWLLDPADLVLDGDRTDPAADDTLTVETAEGTTQVWQVRHPAGLNPWQYDHVRGHLRVHTILVSEATTP